MTTSIEQRALRTYRLAATLGLLATAGTWAARGDELRPIKYNNPGLVVDLAVGLIAVPMPMDYDSDGDIDLLVSWHGPPSGGLYFYENTEGDVKMPVFAPAVSAGPTRYNMAVSYVRGEPQFISDGLWFRDFGRTRLGGDPTQIPFSPEPAYAKDNQWTFSDYDGDGVTDLIVGAGDWCAYGERWDAGRDQRGRWRGGSLSGGVYFMKNQGTFDQPSYAPPLRLRAAGAPIEIPGFPSPNVADFDGDGDLDLICGEFLDRLQYFQNTGTRIAPRYAEGVYLRDGAKRDGSLIRMDLQMIKVTAFDWDKDGDMDLLVGEEDGRVSLVEHTDNVVDGVPVFIGPRVFRQRAQYVKVGASTSVYSFDWDGDGDEDLICGNTAGYLEFVENLDGHDPPKWAAPVRLKASGRTIRLQAGQKGSVQGPYEAKWGYTVPSVADWNHDGLPDIMVNSIWGHVVWYQNVGTQTEPRLRSAQPVIVQWDGPPPKPKWTWWDAKPGHLVTQWRTSPRMIDLSGDGLLDLVMLDHEGYLALFERRRVGTQLRVLPPKRVFRDRQGQTLRLNDRSGGRSGRVRLQFVDWNGDGRVDLLTSGKNVNFWRNVTAPAAAKKGTEFMLHDEGPVDTRVLAGHAPCPAIVDWNCDGVPDLLVGADDGYLYHMKNPR